jgi:CTP-dependent riboflavin kinase
MITISGRVWRKGAGDFKKRMNDFPEAFLRATGERLFPGTLNVEIDKELPVEEHFRVRDVLDPEQDLLFEICRVGQIWAYRIRPCNRKTGAGGHGDHIIEITSSQKIPNSQEGAVIEISFFRDNQ